MIFDVKMGFKNMGPLDPRCAKCDVTEGVPHKNK